jgi:hypothetical protein
MKDQPFILTLIIRIIALPFYMGIVAIGHMVIFVRMCIGFLCYGGETITYTKNQNRKTIEDVYNKLKQIQGEE